MQMVKFNLKRLQTGSGLGGPQKPKCLRATTLECLLLNFWAIYFDQLFFLPTSHTTLPSLRPPFYIQLSELSDNSDWKGVRKSILSSLCSGQGQPADQTGWSGLCQAIENLQGWRLHSLPGPVLPCWTSHPRWEKAPPVGKVPPAGCW